MGILKPRQIGVRRDGQDIYVLLDGRSVLGAMDWRSAKALAILLIRAANKCEEHEKADSIVFDQALLLRRGWGFLGLSNNRDIQHEAMKEAGHNTTLRKAIPHISSSIQSQEAVGTPTLIKEPPGKKDNGNKISL